MSDSTTTTSEEFLTFKQAAERLNLPYYKVQRAVKNNIIPHYRLYNSRKLVRMSDILAAMEPSAREPVPKIYPPIHLLRRPFQTSPNQSMGLYDRHI